VVVQPAGSAQAMAAPLCKKKSGKTLVKTRKARVFRRQRRVYACLSRARRVFRLGGPGELGFENEVGNFRLAGRYVAYSQHESQGLRVKVKELRRGRVVRDVKAARVIRLPFEFLTDMELRGNGSVAWIVAARPIDVPLNRYAMPTDYLPSYEVGKADRTGRFVLAAGHYIVAGSLALGGATISWRNAGRRYSAILH
jgi:hypothetical protein